MTVNINFTLTKKAVDPNIKSTAKNN